MIVHYDPETKMVTHTVGVYGPDYLRLLNEGNGGPHFRLASAVPHEDIRIVELGGALHPQREVDGELHPLELWSPAQAPERSLDGVRTAALARVDEKRQQAVQQLSRSSPHHARKEAWAKAHLAGDLAHPMLNAEAVHKRITCFEMADRILKRAVIARSRREQSIAEMNAHFDHLADLVRAATSIEEIDDFLAHIG